MKIFFEPSGIIIAGATDNPAKPQYYLPKNILEYGYQGKVFLVNPRLKELFGRKVYPSISSVPESVDLAMLVVPSRPIPGMVAECGRKGIKGVIIGSGGFGEKGAGGQALMEETLAAARPFGLSIMGPNSIGTVNTALKLTCAFIDSPIPSPGPISFVTQTGLVGGPMLHWITSVAKIACLGNHSDVDAGEVVDYYADDPATGVIGVHSEGLNEPRLFVEALCKCRRAGKPVVLVKTGNSSQGAMIASSHTGSMSADHEMLLVAARQAGAILADDFEDFFLTLKVLAQPRQEDKPFAAAVVSVSGAALVMAGDKCAKLGLKIAAADGDLTCVKGKALYDAGAWSGDIDIGGIYYDMVSAALSQPEVTHCVLFMVPTPKLFNFDPGPVFARLRQEFPDKALVAGICGHRRLAADWAESLEAEGIPCCGSVESALTAIARHQKWLQRNK